MFFIGLLNGWFKKKHLNDDTKLLDPMNSGSHEFFGEVTLPLEMV